MKAITVLQPWASLIACGAKKIETRSWATSYRGPIAIHAGKSEKYYGMEHQEPFLSALRSEILAIKDVGGSVEAEYDEVGVDLPYGKVIAIADLVDCVKVVGYDNFAKSPILDRKSWLLGDAKEIAFGDYSVGRYAWILDNVRRIDPVPAKGKQRLWEWEGVLA